MSRLLDAPGGGLTYAAAGVSLADGDDAVSRIAPIASATAREGVVAGVGGFAGLFAPPARYADPLLVASADGVGTKLEVARRLGRFDAIGVDLVAMLVDDLVCSGAEPLFVLDYVAVGRLDPARVAAVVSGVAEGCALAGAALLGGETAEHPDTMEPDAIDLAGFAVGVVERARVLGPERVRAGDRLLGLPSPGLRSNGYSLARRAFAGRPLEGPAWDGADVTLGEELLRPSVIYAPTVLALLADLGLGVHAAAHVTGGGIVGNVARILGPGLDAAIDLDAFATPEIFFEVQRAGRVSA
ncbi:MAG TPA: phosphoribosylformylglycinamidine cyclo-ligase, partial [Acidimicrobiales bacterium]|nr:phosphoribosylformylglycinamidine cyclo-ligase [Acidimicrobiales bacterium]